MTNSAGNYHKAIIGGIAAGLVAAIAVLTGAMTSEDTFGDVATVTWLYALSAFIVGSGITGGAVAWSRKNDGDALNEEKVQELEAAITRPLATRSDFPQEAGSGGSAPSPVLADPPSNPGGQKG